MNIRPGSPADFDAFVDAAAAAFGARVSPAERERDRRLLDPTRILLAEDAGRIIGTAASTPLHLALPGAVGPAAGVTGVSVAPDARRQGVLTALMQRQFDDLRAAASEPVAALFASEAAIYPRFGFGLAARELRYTVRGHPAYRASTPGPVRVGPANALRAEIAARYERCWAGRPGYFARSEPWWDAILADDEEDKRASPLTAVLTEGGYAVYRTKLDWQQGRAAGLVDVVDLLAPDAAGEARLWRHLTDLDLMPDLRVRGVALDCPLPLLLVDPRAGQATVHDNLWLRLLDVPAALAMRRYATELDVVLRVHDQRCAANDAAFRLTVAPSEVHCTQSDDEPHLELDVSALGAAYLGGTTLLALAAAGQLRELRSGSLIPASLAFRGMREPVCPWIF